MKLCDRCPGYASCLLNYNGEACRRWRKAHAPEVVYTQGDRLRDAEDATLAATLCAADFCECCAYADENLVCHFVERQAEGRLYDGCMEAAMRWLQSPAEN